jgi:hypothetical protein
VDISRRKFFKVSLLGSAVLFVGSSLSTFALARLREDDLPDFDFLNVADAELLLVLAPVMLKANYPGLLGKEADHRLLTAIDKQIFALDEHSQKQLRQLFDLLSSFTLRYLAGAPISDWALASPEQLERFLQGWKTSMFSLKRSGYAALSKLITMGWYIQPENFLQAGYPGPPKIVPPQE